MMTNCNGVVDGRRSTTSAPQHTRNMLRILIASAALLLASSVYNCQYSHASPTYRSVARHRPQLSLEAKTRYNGSNVFSRVARGCVAFVPRGGAIGRRGKVTVTNDSTDIASISDADTVDTSANNGEETTSESFNLEQVSKQLKQEEIENIKKDQQFLKKQQQRREMDKTWLDKGITAVVEFFENVFRWEVLD